MRSKQFIGQAGSGGSSGTSGTTARLLTQSACTLLLGASLAACGGGGGSEPPPTESALVQSVSTAQVLEGDAGAPQLEFVVRLDRPAVVGVDVTFSTASTAKAGVASLGSATAGASCAEPAADYVSVANSRLRIAQGAAEGKLVVAVCPDARFEPTETLRVDWTSARAAAGGGAVQGTIVNDDAGGLNGTGASTSLGGVPTAGRDTNPLTNGSADGALGFSFAATAGTTGPNCTLDKVTGLTWQALTGFSGSYDQAATYAASFDNCGFADWRVPTVAELLSLLDASRTTAVNADAAISGSTMAGSFWTNELKTPGSVDAFTVDIGNGGGASFVAKSGANGVRLVRGGTVYPACDNANNRFGILGDGTVADSKTGLMWKQCHEGLAGASCTAGASLAFADVSAVTTRLGAVNAPSSADGLGYSDWRIPSKNELDSLANRACPGGIAANTAVFPATDSMSYLSATLDPNNPGLVWFVNFGDGSVSTGTVANKRLRLVRGGQ